MMAMQDVVIILVTLVYPLSIDNIQRRSGRNKVNIKILNSPYSEYIINKGVFYA